MRGRRRSRGAVVRSFALALALVAPAARAEDAVVAPAPRAPIEVPYPAEAHGDGEVVLEVLVAEDGSVSRVVVKSGAEPFAEAARRHVESALFTPATRNGLPVRARIAVRVLFREPAPPPVAGEDLGPASEAVPAAKPPPREEPAAEVRVLGVQRTELGSIYIPKDEARRVPGAFGDPFRVVEVLPGVAPVLSGLPYFFVRGSPPGNVGYFLDGIRVPILFHVGPGPSVVTPLLVERVDLYPGSYPARFGRYGGAIFSGETTTPLPDRARAEGQARVFDTSAAIEHPFDGGRGSVLAGGRQSFTQAVLAAVAPDYELGYSDYQGRVTYAVTPSDRLTVLGFGGYDVLRNKERAITLFNVGFHRLDLRWDRALEGTGRVRVGLTLSHDTVRAAPEDEGASGVLQKSTGARVRAEAEQDLAEGVRLRVGGDLAADAVRGDREQIDERVRVYPDRTDVTAGAHADAVLRPTRAVEIVPGLRFDQLRSRGTDHSFLEPRVGARVRLARATSYIAGAGLAHQVPAVAIRMPGRPPNLLERSVQEVAQASHGIEYALPWRLLGRTTLFLQRTTTDSEASGRAYGAEQFLRRDFTERFGGFISYTLSRTELTAGTEQRLASYDRTHVLSAVLGYDLGGGFRIGGRGYLASGRAVRVWCPTVDCAPGGDPGGPLRDVVDLRLPTFVRLDTRLEKRWKLGRDGWITATFEWFNATLSSETEDAYYTSRDGIRRDRRSPLTLPSLGVEAGF